MGQLSSIKVKNRLLNIYGPAEESSYGYAIIYCCFVVNGMGWRKSLIYKRKFEIYFFINCLKLWVSRAYQKKVNFGRPMLYTVPNLASI